MNNQIVMLKDQFLELLLEISKTDFFTELSSFIYGEDAFLLKLHFKGELTAKEISDELKITKGRVTALINALVKQNKINVKINRLDRRSLLISLSDHGKEYLNSRFDSAENHFITLFSLLGYDNAFTFVNSIKLLYTKLKDSKDE